MDRLKKSRTPFRSQATRIVNECTALIDAGDPDLDDLQTKLTFLSEIMDTLRELDVKIRDQQLDDDVNADEIEAEVVSQGQYRQSYLDIKRKVGKLSNHRSSPTPSEDTQSSASAIGDAWGRKRALQLPTIIIKPFDGTLKGWLSWWSQFSKIHEDTELDDTDKFQYLSQSIQDGTEAKELLSSYPQTAENYPRAIDALTDRYGTDDLQLQFYVRELLTLVITNVTNKDKLPLASLYLKLESHLRCLATLKLDQADPSTWLFPLVESSLREETLRDWKHSPLSKLDGSTQTSSKTRLELLIDFLKGEVRTDQQVSLINSTFGQPSSEEETTTPQGKGKAARRGKQNNSEEIATAAGLMSAVVSCAFCDGKHDSDRCVKAQSMAYPEKKEKVEVKKLCFKCLRPGHGAKECKAIVRCIICGGKHYAVMCHPYQDQPQSQPKEMPQQYGSTPNSLPPPHSMNYAYGYTGYEQPPPQPLAVINTYTDPATRSSSSANHCSSDVILNTILVKIKGKHSTFTVRLVGDTGSQRSYIRTDVAKQLGCERIGEEWLQNVLFGGMTTPPILSQKYNITFIHPITSAESDFHLLERKEICGQLSKIPNGPWLQELQQQGITISDVGSGCHNVDVLLGNDYWGNVLTGRILKLTCGLVAVETIFGWTLSGRVPSSSSNLAVSVVSMFVSNADTSNPWNLEALGIRDPIQTKSKQEDEQEAISHLSSTVNRDETGRYCVCLPWKNKEPHLLPTNRHIAQRRLVRATNQLKKQNEFHIYDEVFQLWEKEGFISVVSDDQEEHHYPPHRPVFKEGSFVLKEYLALLVQRGKEKKRTLKPGDVELVGAANQKRFRWPLGFIIPGRDGECRVAKVKTSSGILVRPFQRLFSLEISGGDELAARFKTSQNTSPEVKASAPTPSESVRVVLTNRGRISKKPARYGNYFNLSI